MLTKKAFLNGIQLVVDQLTRIVVGFLLMPILLAELGPAVFGIWQVLQKASLQISMLDGRSAEVLKWVIASKQGESTITNKQQAVASGLIILLLFVPLLLMAYGILMAVVPSYLDLEAAVIYQSRFVIALLAIAAIITASAMLFEAVIRGSNQAYKLLGFQAFVLAGGGLMSAVVVTQGEGILGLAYVQVLVALLFFVAYFFIAKKHIAWLGFSRPKKIEFVEALHKSKWFSLWAFVSALVFTGDVIIMAGFLDATIVSQYVLTSYSMQLVTVAILTALASILPGLGGILGGGDYDRADSIRQESLLLTWWLTTTMCVVLMVSNRSFMELWVGENQYLGDGLNLLIALATFQLVFIRHDANLLNVALDVKKKTFLALSCVVVTFALMAIFIPLYDVYGVCYAVLLGRSILFICYPRIVSKVLRSKFKFFGLQKIIVTGMAFFAGWELSGIIVLDTWWQLAIGIGLLSTSLLVILYLFGMSRAESKRISSRVKILLTQ